MIASSGHTMEYVGSGTDYRALPEYAAGTYTLGSGTSPNGVHQESHQKVERNNGKVWAAITDHNGKFRVGDTFSVDQQSGFVSIPAGALSVNTLLENLDVNGKKIVSDSNNENVVISPHGTGTVDVESSRITSVSDPTGAQDAATKAYVDSLETDLVGGQLDNRYFRQDSTETITSGATWSSADTHIATTAAIDARVIDLVDDVGGFVPIANETSFPTANPDVNNGAGTLISIKEIATSRTPSSGTVTIANGSGSNTVTITGCGSTVLASGYGAIVETTSTLHTYTFHRLTPLATEVTTVAANVSNISTVATDIADVSAVATDIADVRAVQDNLTDIGTVAGISANVTTVAGISSNVTSVANDASDIGTVASDISNVNTVAGSISNVNTVATNMSGVNDFAARYRVSASAPTTSLNDGDLWFDTTNDTLKVYDASSSAWVTGVTDTAGFVTTAGATMTGQLNTVTPSSGDNATNKTYVDGTIDSKIDTALTTDVVGGTGITVSDDTPGNGQITVAVTAGSIGATQLASTAVTAGTYGASQNGVASFTVDADGRLTAASTDTSPTFDGNVTLNANLDMQDNDKILLGTSDDLEIYHDGSNSYVDNDTGHLNIRQFTNDGNISFYNDDGSGNTTVYLQCTGSDGAVRLNHYGSQKFITKSDGIDVTGEVQCDSLDVDGNADINGQVGFKSAPTADRTLEVESSANAGIRIKNSSAANGAYLNFWDAQTSGATQNYFGCEGNNLVYKPNNSEVFRFNSAGGLLIGTTTEGQAYADNLTLNDGGNCGLTIRSGSTNVGSIYFSDATSGPGEYDGFIQYNQSSRVLQLGTATNTRMFIDASGRAAIGNTTPSSFTGNGSDNLVVGSGSGNEGITIYSGSSNTGALSFGDGTSGDAAYRGGVEYNHSTDKLQFRAGGTANRVTISSSGNIVATGTVSASGFDLASLTALP
jgi:hypothetical protein